MLIIRYLVVKLNSVMLEPLAIKLRPLFLQETQRFMLAKSVVVFAVITVIVLIGVMTRMLIFRKTFLFFEKILYKLPMVNKIYGALKEISNAFLGKKKGGFQKVVMVEYPRKGIYTLGFVTSEAKGELQSAVEGKDLINIYVPTTPNPTSGMFVLFNKNDVIPLDINVEEALKVVISAGAISPLHRNKTKDLDGNTKV
jgi:uncharacterized membrane protein